MHSYGCNSVWEDATMLSSSRMVLRTFRSSYPFKWPPFISQVTSVEAQKFLVLAQGHAMTHSEFFLASVLVALNLKKGRLSQVLNQISIKLYDCIELFSPLISNSLSERSQEFRWRLKAVQLPGITYSREAEHGREGKRATRKKLASKTQAVVEVPTWHETNALQKHHALGEQNLSSSKQHTQRRETLTNAEDKVQKTLSTFRI